MAKYINVVLDTKLVILAPKIYRAYICPRRSKCKERKLCTEFIKFVERKLTARISLGYAAGTTSCGHFKGCWLVNFFIGTVKQAPVKLT